MYFRFLFLMSLGMFGMGLVLTTLFDSFLEDWDLGGDLARYIEGLSRKARLIHVHEYIEETAQVRTRVAAARTPLPREIRLTEMTILHPAPLLAPAPVPTPAPLPLPPLLRRPTVSAGARALVLTPPPTPRPYAS